MAHMPQARQATCRVCRRRVACTRSCGRRAAGRGGAGRGDVPTCPYPKLGRMPIFWHGTGGLRRLGKMPAAAGRWEQRARGAREAPWSITTPGARGRASACGTAAWSASGLGGRPRHLARPPSTCTPPGRGGCAAARFPRAHSAGVCTWLDRAAHAASASSPRPAGADPYDRPATPALARGSPPAR